MLVIMFTVQGVYLVSEVVLIRLCRSFWIKPDKIAKHR